MAAAGEGGAGRLGALAVAVDAGDAVAACRMALRQRLAEAAAGPGDEYPSLRHPWPVRRVVGSRE